MTVPSVPVEFLLKFNVLNSDLNILGVLYPVASLSTSLLRFATDRTVGSLLVHKIISVFVRLAAIMDLILSIFRPQVPRYRIDESAHLASLSHFFKYLVTSSFDVVVSSSSSIMKSHVTTGRTPNWYIQLFFLPSILISSTFLSRFSTLKITSFLPWLAPRVG